MNGKRWTGLAAVVVSSACADPSQPLTPVDVGLSDVRRPAAGAIRIIDLGTLGGRTSSAGGINTPATGRPVLIVGTATTAEGKHLAAYWSYDIASGTLMAAKALISDAGAQSGASSVNAAEQISGWSYESVTATGPNPSRAVRWTLPDAVTFLGTFGGTHGQASDIDADGRILGFATSLDGTPHGFLWDPSPAPEGTLNNLGFSGTDVQPADRNETGTIVGAIRVTPGALQTAFVWRAGALMLLPDLGPPPPGAGVRSYAAAVNNAGVIVGSSYSAAFGQRAVRWNPTSDGGYSVQDLDLGLSSAHDINNAGEIVGQFQTKRNGAGFYLSPTTFKQLPILSWGAGARAINEHGDIIGFSYYRSTYEHAVLWTNVRGP